MIASGLLDFCRCCALRLGNNGQIKIIPFCVSSEEHIMPCLYHFHGCLRLLVLAGMHPVYLVGSLLEALVVMCPLILILG
jgi:hypothetical protein